IFTMTGVTRVHPPEKRVLENIHLAFYPGAKIGVLGVNGSGKSSLLRIMAGVDKDYLGEAKPADGIRIGFLSQEPHVDPNKTVRDEVEAAVHETRSLVHRFEEIGTLLGQDPPDMDK